MFSVLVRHIRKRAYECCTPDDPAVKWGNFKTSGWWKKSGYNSDSNEISVALPSSNYCFDPAKTYHLWYAEDMHDVSESDNHGTAKTDVFVWLPCPAGSYAAPGKEGCKGTVEGCEGEVGCDG